MSRDRRPKTYGEELRTSSPEKLSRGELAQLRAERAWEAAHPSEVAALDAFVGQRVALLPKASGRPYATWAEDLGPEDRKVPGMPGTLIPTHLRAGLAFVVVMRLGDRLLGVDAVGEPWLLRREWLRLAHRVDHDRGSDQTGLDRSGGAGASGSGSAAAVVVRKPRPML